MNTSNFLDMKKHYAEQSKRKIMNELRRRMEEKNPPKRENNKSTIQKQKTRFNTTQRDTPSVAKGSTPNAPSVMAPTTGPASQGVPGVREQNIASVLNASAGKRSEKSSKSLASEVSKNDRIKKQPKTEPQNIQLNSSAVPIPTSIGSFLSQPSDASVKVKKNEDIPIILPQDSKKVKKNEDIASINCDGLFEGMDASYLDQFPLSCLDLPPPEEFFAETSAAKSGSDANKR